MSGTLNAKNYRDFHLFIEIYMFINHFIICSSKIIRPKAISTEDMIIPFFDDGCFIAGIFYTLSKGLRLYADEGLEVSYLTMNSLGNGANAVYLLIFILLFFRLPPKLAFHSREPVSLGSSDCRV
jgi:hypothetical protein